MKQLSVQQMEEINGGLQAGANLKSSSSGGVGQAVANCISAAYTNNGWLSVWAFVQTAFIPETALAIAGACWAQNG